jgi:hypothetical protein
VVADDPDVAEGNQRALTVYGTTLDRGGVEGREAAPGPPRRLPICLFRSVTIA